MAAEKECAEEQDPSRPTIFSYPDTVPMANNSYDIYSKHYPDVHSSLDSSPYPLLNDEFAHVSCYNLDTLRRDPGVRNFWGESIKRFGEKFLADDGCLGGSIWAGIDDVFLLPGGPTGYGEWGIIRTGGPHRGFGAPFSPAFDDRVNDYLITGPQFSLVVSKQTGLITEATLGQEPILQGGPFLDVGSGAITSWLMTQSEVKSEENRVIILTRGAGKAVEGIDGIPVQFEIVIDADGGITTRYRAGIKSGDHPNLGIAYLLPDSFDKLTWKRKALWSGYPDDHIGRTALPSAARLIPCQLIARSQHGPGPKIPAITSCGENRDSIRARRMISALSSQTSGGRVWVRRMERFEFVRRRMRTLRCAPRCSPARSASVSTISGLTLTLPGTTTLDLARHLRLLRWKRECG